MTEVNITTEETARCLAILESATEPIVAAELARRLGLAGSRETKRRHVRAIIEYLRKNGSWIVGLNPKGYFLTKDHQIWRDYNEGRSITAKRIFAEVHKRKLKIKEGSQGVLFDTRIRCGVATKRTG